MTPRRWMPMRLRLLLAEAEKPARPEYTDDWLDVLAAVKSAELRLQRRRNLARRSLKLRARPVSVRRSRPMRGLPSHPDRLERFARRLVGIPVPVNTGSLRRQVSS